MKVLPTRIAGVHVVEPEAFHDERGIFARTWDIDVLAENGLETHVAQSSASWNRKAGTLRGLHFQRAPHEEAKLVRCTSGAIFDVAVDLRPGSPTYTQWVGIELTADNRRALYIPRGFAHGFISLTDGAEVYYQISTGYHPEAAGGYSWNDPAFAISWPLRPEVISDRDSSWPPFAPEATTA